MAVQCVYSVGGWLFSVCIVLEGGCIVLEGGCIVLEGGCLVCV